MLQLHHKEAGELLLNKFKISMRFAIDTSTSRLTLERKTFTNPSLTWNFILVLIAAPLLPNA